MMINGEAANAPITFQEIVMVMIICSSLTTLPIRGFKMIWSRYQIFEKVGDWEKFINPLTPKIWLLILP